MNSNLIKFQEVLKQNNLDGFIVTNPTNIFYLTGFKGVSPGEREAILIFSPRLTLTKPVLITARLYQQEATSLKSADLKIDIAKERNELFQKARELISNAHLRGVRAHPEGERVGLRVGFEENDLTFGEYQGLTPKSLEPLENLVEDLRVIKTQDEIKKIETAQIISQKAFAQLVKTIKVGQSEEEIAANLAAIIKSGGGQGLAFESIMASGPNSGKPHHVTGNRRVTKNDILLFDFGAKYADYCADLARTIFIGKANDRFKNIFDHVQKAQKLALEDITHGHPSSHPYQKVVNHFKKHKLAQYFLHGLGHGIGLEVHEKPHLRPLATQARLGQGRQAGLEDEELKENMVFSVEPGLYFPWGGVRIEDLVVIQNGRAKVLGKLTEEIIEI